jgi:hypothetical protein
MDWAERKQIEILRRMSPARRFRVGMEMIHFGLHLLRASIRAQMPHAPARRRREEYYHRLLGADWARKLMSPKKSP